MSASWPSSLPSIPLQDSFNAQRDSGILRSSIEYGFPQQRKRANACVLPYEASFRLTRTQKSVLDTFFFTTLLSGSLSFSAIHPMTGKSVTCRFTDVPNYTPEAAEFSVSCKLEVLP